MKKNTASTNPELLSPKRKPTSPSKTETAKRQLKKAAYLEASHYILDLSKLIFGGVILANIRSLEINKILTFAIGITAVSLLTVLSFVLFLKGKE